MEDEHFEAELHKQLTYWQRTLYLQDWNIELRISRQWEMADAETVAQCQWFLQRKDAIIKVLHPSDLPGLSARFIREEECDYDISLVHELLHLHFAPFHHEDHETFHEQAINAISRGMVKAWRESSTAPTHHNLVVHPAKEGYL